MALRILLAGGGTGGHLYAALNIARALRREEREVDLFYLGAERGLESRILPEVGPEIRLPYRLVPIHPLYRSRPWRNWRLVARTPEVLYGVARAFASFGPHAAVGTGGYASGPPLAWARLSGTPIALQEQNAEPGFVTRVLARRAAQVHLGFEEAAARLELGPETAVRCHGNPVSPLRAGGEPPDAGEGAPDAGGDAPNADGDAAASRFEWPEGRVLLVAGGSQGARGLNERIGSDLRRAEAWPEEVRMVWISGEEHEEDVRRMAARTPWTERIRVVPFVPDLGARLGGVSLAVSRAGAMFVSELAAAGVPAVLVPFPAAAGAHQEENARALTDAGAAVLRRQEELAPGQLWSLIRDLLEDEERRSRMARAARRRGRPDAAERIARDVLSLATGEKARREAGGDR